MHYKIWGFVHCVTILCNRICIYIFVLIIGFYYKYVNNVNGSRRIIVLFPQQIGDILLFSEPLNRLLDIYRPEEGWRITLLARKEVVDFAREVLPIRKEINPVGINMTEITRSFSLFRRVKYKYLVDVKAVVVPNISVIGSLLSAATKAENKIGMGTEMDCVKPLYMKIIDSFAYTVKIKPHDSLMMIQRYKQLLKYLGDKGYKAALPRLKCSYEKENSPKPYSVICVGGSFHEKLWPLERFESAINYLIENTGEDIYLIGSREDYAKGELIKGQSNNPGRIFNMAGKTNYKEWIDIISRADFVVGNDSASIHIAAALRIPSICITGPFDKNQFFPYKLDEEEKYLPIVVCREKECAFCRTRGGYMGYGNQDCQKHIKEQGYALCISEITAESVIDAIKSITVSR